MRLNISYSQIGRELDLCESDVQMMTSTLRAGIVDRKPDPVLCGEIEFEEAYVVAGHKGHPEAKKKGCKGRRRRLKGGWGRGTLEKEKPPIFGRIQRGGEVVMRMLANVRRVTIDPIINKFVDQDSIVYTSGRY
ncbi:hypothetical protein SCG7086_BC_00090 [Chlamydiales bacterium SCGC AG-110-P3]|nr:hypothetical protein SCG7086_BC_00090 [Chlamydiales bacterium SCGC AG-110-P3]